MAFFDRFKRPPSDQGAAPSTATATPDSAPPVPASRPESPAQPAAQPTAEPAAPSESFSDYQPLIDQGHVLPLDDPAFQRKLRSEERLQAMNVPTLAWLPMIPGAGDATMRTQVQVVERAVCLMAVAIKAEVARDGDWASFAPIIDDILDSHDARSGLTPAEQAFLADPAPDDQTNTQFGWRYEAFSTLLWALGYNIELPWPTSLCDVGHDCGIVKTLGPEGFSEQATLRSAEELLDEADHIYRLHWAVRNSRVNGTFAVPAVDGGVVMERHHTLNWLMSYNDQDWDHVSTDT